MHIIIHPDGRAVNVVSHRIEADGAPRYRRRPVKGRYATTRARVWARESGIRDYGIEGSEENRDVRAVNRTSVSTEGHAMRSAPW